VSGEQCTRGLRVRVGWRWRRCGDGVPSRQGRRWLQTCGGWASRRVVWWGSARQAMAAWADGIWSAAAEWVLPSSSSMEVSTTWVYLPYPRVPLS
jgi:hypothetical protein